MKFKYKPGDRVVIANSHTLPKEIRGKTVTIKALINYITPCYFMDA